MRSNRYVIKYCRSIAKMYGCKVEFTNKICGGLFWVGKGRITVSTNGDQSEIIDVFCHELAHFLNACNDKFPLYHNYQYLYLVGLFKNKKKLCAYAHRAEVYTEKVGKRLCKTYFPGTLYRAFYRTGRKKSINSIIAYWG